MGRVVVVGSLNVDHIVRVQRHPEAGETVTARAFASGLGGKGFNQAVTAARMGADVVMVGCVGADADGDHLLRALKGEGVDAGFVRRHAELPTGRAHITVDQQGQNSIVVVPGANAAASFPSAVLEGATVLLAQLECPLEVVSAAIAAARISGVVTILNPAPAQTLTNELLGLVDYLIANETEADSLGRVSYRGIAVITGGARGALVLVPGRESRRLPALTVPVVDSTGAGDAFCGCFAATLACGGKLGEALRRASAAGAHAVTSEGAFASLPSRADVDQLLHQSRTEAQS
ncbi:MAG: ribokinase [Acidimicrobiaceae bacterium]|jgi:ribokinase